MSKENQSGSWIGLKALPEKDDIEGFGGHMTEQQWGG